MTPRVRPRGALTFTVSHAHSKVGGGCGYSWPRAEACPQNDTLKSQSPAPVNEALFGNRVLAEVTTLDAAITHETGVRTERGDLGSGGAEGWPWTRGAGGAWPQPRGPGGQREGPAPGGQREPAATCHPVSRDAVRFHRFKPPRRGPLLHVPWEKPHANLSIA